VTGKRKLVWSIAVVLAVAFTWYSVSSRMWAERYLAHSLYGHQHCIKATAMAFLSFADDNDGRYPYHTNGWGDALLLLVKSNYADISLICGPNDDGRVFREAMEKGTDVPEELCSRVYVQGLTDSNASGLLILFDREPFPGGDHFYGLGEPIRECLDGDGSMVQLNDKLWPIWRSNNMERLIELGFSRKEVEGYYPAENK
jgi:hypothetical protein